MDNRYTNKGVTLEHIQAAMAVTLSNRAAARYLGIGLPTYKKYASMHIDPLTGKNLYEMHMNAHGIGVKKGFAKENESTCLMDILEGKANPSNFTAEKLKREMIKDHLIEEKCECCGFNERRSLDFKVPVILTFRDGNKRNWKRENLFLLCHNCYYLQIADVYSKRQMEAIEGMMRTRGASVQKELEIEEHHMEAIKDIINNNANIYNPPKQDTSGEDLIYRL